MNIRGVWVNTNHKQDKSLLQSLYTMAQEEDQTEWTREEMIVLENKFSTGIKSRYIKYYKTYRTLKK